MKTLKFKTNYNYDPKKHLKVEQTIGDSMTIPEESLTIKQIIAKSVAGNIPKIGQRIAYSGDKQVDYNLDLVELQEASMRAQKLQEQYENEQKARKLSDIKAKRDAWLKKQKEEWAKENPKPE